MGHLDLRDRVDNNHLRVDARSVLLSHSTSQSATQHEDLLLERARGRSLDDSVRKLRQLVVHQDRAEQFVLLHAGDVTRLRHGTTDFLGASAYSNARVMTQFFEPGCGRRPKSWSDNQPR
ncbi:hypothetical protein ACWGE0_12390 [Lentzea sp. NPDC054927]